MLMWFGRHGGSLPAAGHKVRTGRNAEDSAARIAADTGRLHRFEQEAGATGAASRRDILSIPGIGWKHLCTVRLADWHVLGFKPYPAITQLCGKHSSSLGRC